MLCSYTECLIFYAGFCVDLVSVDFVRKNAVCGGCQYAESHGTLNITQAQHAKYIFSRGTTPIIVKRVSWFKSSLLLRIQNQYTQ